MSPKFRKQSFEITSFFNINGKEGIHFFVLTPTEETDTEKFHPKPIGQRHYK
jgi:hypothetical protein